MHRVIPSHAPFPVMLHFQSCIGTKIVGIYLVQVIEDNESLLVLQKIIFIIMDII